METARRSTVSEGGEASVVSAIPNQETSLPSDSRGHQKAASLERRTSNRSFFATLRKASDQNRVSPPEPEAEALPSLCFPDCVPQAVVASVQAPIDSPLIAAAIAALDEALARAERDSRHLDGALLALTKAAVSNDPALVCKCFGETECVRADEDDEKRGYFTRLQAALHQGEVSTVLPVRIARRYAHNIVAGELLARTGINRPRGHVDWHETELLHLDEYCLHKVNWVKTLNVVHCRIESLPQLMASHLKQVVKLELQFNQLESIPGCLLELPCLNELNLSHNKLRDFPPVPLWSPALTTLDLSHNDLTTLPGDPKAASLHTLNLSHNQLTYLPPCICGFFSLTSLTLSGNRSMRALPLEMGALPRLAKLELGDMELLEDPPKKTVAVPGECIQYLRSKFLAPKPCYQIKVVVLGNPGRGKSTLVARLQGKTPHASKVTGSGLEVTSLECKPALGKKAVHYLIWNIKGEKSFAIHQCFLTERCVCLLVFDISRGSTEIKGLRPWLDSLALYAPDSCVLLVGTHQDRLPSEESPNMADTLLQMVARVGNEYSTRLCIMEVLGVGLKTGGEELRTTLYSCTEKYSVRGVAVMGEAVPSKYLQLWRLIPSLKGERHPVMEEEEFVALASRAGVEGHELMDVTRFLVSVGAILHYDDPNCRLNMLYFLDPCWLCDAILKMVADCEANYTVNKGLITTSQISVLFEAEKFPWKYFKQFLVFLDKFDIAVPIDSQCLLVPSVLTGEGPVDLFVMRECYIRYILFDAQVTLSFWTRLLTMLLHMVPEINTELPTPYYSNDDPPTTDALQPGGGAVTKATTVDAALPLKHLVYWRTGMAYWNPKVSMRVESMNGSQHFSREGKEGVAITVSHTEVGERVLCQVVDLVMTLANDWCPYVQGRACHGNGIRHLAVCPRCMKLGRPLPHEFNVAECLSLVSRNRGFIIECGYNKPGSESHTTPLVDLVPDLLLKDIDARFFIGDADLAGGTSTKRHAGSSFRNPHQLLDLKRRRWGSDLYGDYHLFAEFRHEATLLQRCGHPCLQGFVGVSTPRLMTIVMERAPLGTLEACLVVKQRRVHRLVLHRMVAQMAAGLLYLHDNGIILHGPRSLNDIVVWSLEPDCLCHCKLGNFSAAMRLTRSGVRKMHAIKEGLAPEVGQAMASKGCSSAYQISSDIFQLGTLIYQMLMRKCRISQLKPTKVPLPNDNGCYYLPLLAQWCHQMDPVLRPSTSDVMDRVSQASFQSLVQLQPLPADIVMRQACVITSAHFGSIGLPSCEGEFWLLSDCNIGTAIDMYHVRSLARVGGVSLQESCIQSVCVCREYVWVAFRGTNQRGVIHLYTINGRFLAHTVDVGGDGVTCMVPYKEMVYCGTLNGCCLAFSERAREVAKGTRRRSNCVSEVPLDSILVVGGQLWVTHADLIHFLNPDTLEVEGYVSRVGGFVGALVMPPKSDLVWSAHLGWGGSVSAWSAEKGVHLYDVPLQQHLRGITICSCEQDMVVTAMAPVLDTVWVGTATGHILIFHGQELLMWFHPYQKHVSVLLCCPSEGGGGAMVVSGGRGVLNPVKGEFPTFKVQEGPQTSGVLALWEAFDAATCRQVWMVQERGCGTFLKSWSSVSDLIGQGKFKDGMWRAEERGSNGSGDVSMSVASGNGLDDVVVSHDHVEPEDLEVCRLQSASRSSVGQ